MENLLDVVVETLRYFQRAARECREEFIIVHYDFAIAKPALQIQASEVPIYNNVFNCFRFVHVELAYFGALRNTSLVALGARRYS